MKRLEAEALSVEHLVLAEQGEMSKIGVSSDRPLSFRESNSSLATVA